MIRINLRFGGGFGEIGVGSIVDDETELLGEVGGLYGVWEWDLMGVSARLGGYFLEGEYEVDEFVLL